LYYLENHQYEVAIRYLQKAVQLNPQNPAAHLALGTAIQQVAVNGVAQRSFKKAFQLDPAIKKYNQIPHQKTHSRLTESTVKADAKHGKI